MAIESHSTHQRESKRHKKTLKTSNPVSDSSNPLPQELIFEILSRLPVKFVLQFRCVCKSWCSLISHPQFVKTHLNITSIRPQIDLNSCSIDSILCKQFDTVAGLDNYPSKIHHSLYRVVGSCNGLVCVAIKDDAVFLWNPSTRKSNRLPKIKLLSCYFVSFGFGYDESIDDYKLVGMFCLGSQVSYRTEVNVYSVRTNSWRRIGEFPYVITFDDSGKFANGALHWAVKGGDDLSNSWIIVSLDLAKETYKEVMKPDYEDGCSYSALGVVGGCLCVLCNYRGTRADVWVMKGFGMREFWTKLVAMPLLTDPWNYQCSIPLCILRNCEILLEFGSYSLVYNPKDGTYSNPKNHNNCSRIDSHTYIESLVSPTADIVIQGQHQY
ncbi:F-box/kelch-repeat protein At3g23880-like [Camellia sinensis]|uniref:F-box domain-containing protein n=1 Tax=Camellia sinensis var. sinensis TaxID=542762 RepID=A0A4S4DR65_CAMSN|nr:F-box/kelch-repeat protein At3g23880-like [Camellia sinensis]XP_028108579.1 F-box/kelch-repeat protein At3g23880-like [Camellia sinensis]XP_028108580.1 F-box/kelch-repeat protein At3g23880-like [Camellia sinensis]XP_028108581.1 F-box/kelch-repeat protein At3g23880-like [Camellia sinensis]XP_028108582.1 F-box/kelch-repeat protein At3g23880-like [Camellia sinensis]THG05611.1 hypothetical protein TEA_000796 [Camellia sinensis var. sinensis]